MLNNYVVYHLHTDYSNAVTNIDSVTKSKDYILKAKELGMKAIAFSEHGSVFDWVKKKLEVEEYGLKYIHGVEAYITENLENMKRDNYHCGLYARNYEGVKEINKLMSIANQRDGHFYYTPRLTFEELLNTSDNVIITTACIGGILNKGSIELKEKFIEFLNKNKHRCFLEVQHHKDDAQVKYNSYLVMLYKEYGIRLIAGTDTHALNEKHVQGRSILQKSKKVFFSEEGAWDLTFKTYDELVEAYKEQACIPEKLIYEAINNTNILADMVEEFELDRCFKYPKLYDNPLDILKSKIHEGILNKGIYEYSNYKTEYIPRINYELETYVKQGAIDYLLLDEDIKSFARKNNIYCGPSRGSVSGSIIAYLIGLTEIDSIKENLNFERFMNKERISLADIDTDWPPSSRGFIKDYIFNKHGLYCAEIITFNTVALKGSIRDVCRALYSSEAPKHLKIADYICSNIENDEEKMRESYPEVFKYVDIINGTITSSGVHACGNVVCQTPLDEHIGLVSLKTSDRPVTTISKNYIEYLNYVKLDVLGLDNIEIINNTCELANIERLTPENVPDDENVWLKIRDNTLCIFQWESSSASSYIKNLFSDETIKKIKSTTPNFKYIDLFSAGNGAIRPAGSSYRDELSLGIVRDNGHKALNDFLSPTLGYLVYQEQIIFFLNKFCDFTMGEADMVRRAFAKKIGTEKYIPKIREGFCEVMKREYGVENDQSLILIENFLKVIIDASEYLFSINHSQAYSYIGYICGYLREYYPLEFFTSVLNQYNSDLKQTALVMEYLKNTNIKVQSPIYGKSKSKNFCDKETNTIYKGASSIKFISDDVADYLYEVSQEKEYKSFVDLYYDIDKLDSRQWQTLIKVGYFNNFGTINYLLKVVDLFNNTFKNKTIKKSNYTDEQNKIISMFAEKETAKQFSGINKLSLVKYLMEGREFSNQMPLYKQAAWQILFMNNTFIADSTCDHNIHIVIEDNNKGSHFLKIYCVNTGETREVRVYKDDYKEIECSDIIYIASSLKKNKKKQIFDETTKKTRWIITDEFYEVITYYKINS